MDRRTFLSSSLALSGSLFLPDPARAKRRQALFSLSLVEYSLHRMIAGQQGKRLDPLDFPAYALKMFKIKAIEYWNGPFHDKGGDSPYIRDMARRAEDAGVKGLLILVDGEGRLGDPDPEKRKDAVDRHLKWLESAGALGLHSIRVNAHSEGGFEEQLKLCADGLADLSRRAEAHKIHVLVENHGGFSSNGAWVAALMKAVNHPLCGTLPDFGNFYDYDRYQGVADMLPWAKAVCAKTHDFDEAGNETGIDYARMMRMVLDSGYRGHVGIEYEGNRLSEIEGVRATQKLLERLRY